MITEQQTQKTIGGGETLESAKYHINPDNTVHITQILRNLYSDPIKAVLREYICNAIDAHQGAGVDKEIEVHIPGILEPYFSVRDFGGGLSIEDTKQLLYGYGSSGELKRRSNEQIGGFGVGCKSAFSICSAFTYTIWHEGRRRTWSCYLDDHDVGQADMLEDVEDDAEPGIKVQIPVKETVANRGGDVVQKLNELFSIMQPKLKLLNTELTLAKAPESVASEVLNIRINDKTYRINVSVHASWGALSNDASPRITIGGIPYLLSVGELDLSGIDPAGKAMLPQKHGWRNEYEGGARILIDMPIGLVQPAPSRESVQYSSAAKKVLSGIVTAIAGKTFRSKLQKSGEKTFKAATFLEKIKRSQSMPWLFTQDSLGEYGERGQLRIKQNECGILRGRTVLLSHMKDGDTTPILYRRRTTTIEFGGSESQWRAPFGIGRGDSMELLFVVVTDIGDSPAYPQKSKVLLNRLANYLVDNKKVTDKGTKVIVLFASGQDTKKKVPWLHDGSVIVVKEGDLPSSKDAKKGVFITGSPWDYKYTNQTTSGAVAVTLPQAKKLGKFVKLKIYETYANPRSKCWETKDPGADGGVFVTLDRFVPVVRCGRNVVTQQDRHHAESVAETLLFALSEGRKKDDPRPAMVKRLLPRTKDGLFGVRIGDVAAVKEDPKHISIWDYIRQRFEEDVRSGKLDVERFAAGVYIYCLKKYSLADPGRDHSRYDSLGRYESRVNDDLTHFGARWLAAAKVIAESDSVGDCELKQRMTWWDNLAYKASTANRTTRDWVELVCACSHAIDTNYYNQSQAGPLGTLARVHFDGGPFVRWSLLRTSEIGNVVYDVSNPGTKVSARRFTPGEAVIAAHDSVIRLDRDLAYMLENHPITCVLFGLGRHSNHWAPSDLTEVVKCDKINKVDCLIEATISNEEYLKFVGDTDRRTQKQKKQTQKGAGIC